MKRATALSRWSWGLALALALGIAVQQWGASRAADGEVSAAATGDREQRDGPAPPTPVHTGATVQATQLELLLSQRRHRAVSGQPGAGTGESAAAADGSTAPLPGQLDPSLPARAGATEDVPTGVQTPSPSANLLPASVPRAVGDPGPPGAPGPAANHSRDAPAARASSTASAQPTPVGR